ncbi:hypothetical protein C7534_125124 [Pseudomonas sp. OV226]|nr:hypothetical protein C7534_125124 [Pseudomonas sp. OV226]
MCPAIVHIPTGGGGRSSGRDLPGSRVFPVYPQKPGKYAPKEGSDITAS